MRYIICIAVILVMMTCTSPVWVQNARVEEGVVLKNAEYDVDGTKFIITTNMPEGCDRGKAMGCVPYWYNNPNVNYDWNDTTIGLINKTVFLRITPSMNDEEFFKNVCNHEMCHIYVSKDEEVCGKSLVKYQECEDLISMMTL